MKKRTIVLIAVFMIAGIAHAQAVPQAPSGVTATLNATGQVSITWTGVTDDAGIGGYSVYRNGTFLTTTAGTSITDSPGVGSYSYTVSAYDNANITSGQSIPSGYISIVPDYNAPTAPTGLTASVATGSVALSWTVATDNVGVAGYYLYRNGAKVVTTDAITGTTYTDTGVYSGAIYKYTVSAYDAAGNISGQSNAVNVSFIYGVQPASAPSSLSAVGVNSGEVDLRWLSAINGLGTSGYYIFRDGAQVGTASGTFYADTGLSPSTTYSYTIAAFDAAGNVSYDNTAASAMTLAPDIIAPTQPANLSAIGITSSGATITWRASSDNVGVTGYNVLRDGTQIATVTSTSYTDSGLATSTSYTYYVSAYDAAGNVSTQSAFTTQTLAVTPASAPIAPTSAGLPVIPAPGATTGVTTAPNPPAVFATTLYIGLRTSDVAALQNVLIAKGYLNAQPTGFFGALTQAAVQKFQCDQNIVCAGSPGTTGWGSVGPKTRTILNGGVSATVNTPTGGGTASANTNTSANASAATTLAQLLAQVQALQAKLAQMQANGQ